MSVSYKQPKDENSRFREILGNLTALPLTVLNKLFYDGRTILLSDVLHCIVCGEFLDRCVCTDVARDDTSPNQPILQMALREEAIERQGMPSGPQKMDGSHDWRHGSHNRETKPWHVYAVTVTLRNGQSAEIKVRNEGPLDIMDAIRRFNIFLTAVQKDDAFRDSCNALLKKFVLLEEVKKDALHCEQKMSGVTRTVSQPDGTQMLPGAEGGQKPNDAMTQGGMLRQECESYRKKITLQNEEIKSHMAAFTDLFVSLMPAYDVEQPESAKTALSKLDSLLDDS